MRSQTNERRLRIAHVTRAVALALFLCLASMARANLVQNGSFESPTAPLSPGWLHSGSGDTIGAGWVVADPYANSAHVDVHAGEWGTPWKVADGLQALDLNGGDAAGVFLDITFANAGAYELSFSMAANTAVTGPGTKFSLALSLDGADVDPLVTYTQYGGESVGNMTWDKHSYLLSIAAPGTKRLAFTSLSRGCCGPAIDDVRLEAVPEPAFLSLGLLLGLGGVCGLRRSYRAHRSG